jgi:hypothetical protein
MTAAHSKLPLGAEVTVTNHATGKQVEVEVNDGGPQADDRAIDLSQSAAKKLGITREGVAEVTIEATKQQVKEAIDGPQEVPKAERQLEDARRVAKADGKPPPKPLLPLEPPPELLPALNGGTIAGGHVSGLGRGRVGSAAHAPAGLYVAPLGIRCLAEDERPTWR